MSRQRQGNPDLRVIDGGAAPESAATTPSSHTSLSPEHGARSERTTALTTRSSKCAPSETETPELRVLVCGSRTWEDIAPIYSYLTGLIGEYPSQRIRVAHGAAQGADTVGASAAEALGLDVEAYPAQWDLYGKRAGFLRNAQMIDEFQPHLVLALSEHPITKGTQHTVNLAKKAGIPVHVISHG